MQLRTAAAVALLALSGCLQPAPGTSAPPLTPLGLAFEAPAKLPGDRIGAEPNMVAGPDGNVWVIAVGSVLADPQQNINRGAVNLWRSADYGATWARQRDPGEQDKNGTWCSCDTDVDLAPDGTLYITDFYVRSGKSSPAGLPLTDPGTNGFVVEASHDRGATWDPSSFANQIGPSGNDRQYVIAGRDPGEVYLAFNSGGLEDGATSQDVLPPLPAVPLPPPSPGGLSLWRSTDGGRTFTPAAEPAPDGMIARPRVGADGTVFFPWVATTQGKESPWNTSATIALGVSHDHGGTFTRHDVANMPNGPGGLWPMQADVGPDGVIHFAWMERVPSGGSVLWYARSADGGSTFTTPRQVGWANGTALLPWIAHAGPSRAVIAFYGSPFAVVPLAAPEDTRWDAWALLVDGNASGEPVRVSPWPVKVGVFCPRGATCTHDRELLDYPGVVWRDGWAHVAFAASRLDAGAGPASGLRESEPRGGHSTNAFVWAARAKLP